MSTNAFLCVQNAFFEWKRILKRIKSMPIKRGLPEDSRLSSILIKLADKGAALKDRRYEPYWA